MNICSARLLTWCSMYSPSLSLAGFLLPAGRRGHRILHLLQKEKSIWSGQFQRGQQGRSSWFGCVVGKFFPPRAQRHHRHHTTTIIMIRASAPTCWLNRAATFQVRFLYGFVLLHNPSLHGTSCHACLSLISSWHGLLSLHFHLVLGCVVA